MLKTGRLLFLMAFVYLVALVDLVSHRGHIFLGVPNKGNQQLDGLGVIPFLIPC